MTIISSNARIITLNKIVKNFIIKIIVITSQRNRFKNMNWVPVIIFETNFSYIILDYLRNDKKISIGL